ncbi:MAG: anthranilate phosphoribosyltransferase [Verrucomicrobia bacterium]|nr:anthranilate phosphoribosyltransferase [Verrucomicrobiota bacterium]
MSVLEDSLPGLKAGTPLDLIQAEAAANELASSEISAATKKAFLIALNEKGEAPAEVAGFAAAFRRLAVNPKLEDYADEAIDVCGTGGDKSHSFNISTAVTLILAASGVKVFKHGNRSITSKCGSAELLQALGVEFLTDPKQLRKALEALNFVFFFAPSFHPAFKEIMPVRQELAQEGRRTIFNILGPMINPGSPAHQLTGVFSKTWVEPMAEAFHTLGLKNGVVVHSVLDAERGMDELACSGTPVSAGFGASWDQPISWNWDDLGLAACAEEDLKGGDLDFNLNLLHDLMDGNAPKGLEDTVALNAGVAFSIVGKADSLRGSIDLARDQLLNGAVENHLENIRNYFSS